MADLGRNARPPAADAPGIDGRAVVTSIGDEPASEADRRALARAELLRDDRIASSHSAETRRAYAGDWSGFVTWCERMRRIDASLVPLPATDRTIATWIGSLEPLAYATVRRKLVAIRFAHARRGVPLEASPLGTEAALRGLGRARAEV